MATPPDVDAGHDARTPAPVGFEVHLDNFSGPFDLLLSLIAKHKLDITEIALGRVTDEFIAYIREAERAAEAARAAGEPHPGWDLGTASEFLLVAATLLDLKAARLLPAGVVDDDEDLALLEARDLLFARLLQYRAYRQVAAAIADRLASEGRRFPRIVQLEPHLAAVLPELVWRLGAAELAALAAQALTPRPEPPGMPLAHLHASPVSVREQAGLLAARIRRQGTTTFRALAADAGGTVVVVARFLALLELFRDGLVGFDQASALGELTVHWSGGDHDTSPDATSEFDEFDEFDGFDENDEPRAAATEETAR